MKNLNLQLSSLNSRSTAAAAAAQQFVGFLGTQFKRCSVVVGVVMVLLLMLLSSLRCFYMPLRRNTLLAFADLPSSSICFSATRVHLSRSGGSAASVLVVPRGLWFILHVLL
ncbi:unnamed protein product [Ectocarpus sp. 6 AP-2014]